MSFFLIYNIITFVTYGLDKLLAISEQYRISELALHILALTGGLIGGFLAMIVFRHKIKKPLFLLIHGAIWIGWIVVWIS